MLVAISTGSLFKACRSFRSASPIFDEEMHQSRNQVDASRERDPKSLTEKSSDGEESE
jgi:hypothetical protein